MLGDMFSLSLLKYHSKCNFRTEKLEERYQETDPKEMLKQWREFNAGGAEENSVRLYFSSGYEYGIDKYGESKEKT